MSQYSEDTAHDDELVVPIGQDILVVDDDPKNLVAIEAALGPLGRRLVLAHSGTEALSRLLEQDFALILLDVMMPKMDGFEAAKLIRSRERNRATPIIFITGLAWEETDILRSYELGAFDFLVKPVRAEVLRAKASVFLLLQERTLALREALARIHDRELAKLYQAEQAARLLAELAKRRALFLSQASAILGASLDIDDTLRNVAQAAVPGIADWCAVELVGEDGVLRQVAVAHVDPTKITLARELRERYPTPPDAPTGVPNVIRTGTSELYTEIPDAMLVQGARDPEHLRLIRELGLRSAMIVPIFDRGRAVGAISFVTAESGERYSADDLQMAEQLGERASVAIANARLYEQAKVAIQLRDDFVSIAGHELRTPLATLSLQMEALLQIRDDTPIAEVRHRGTKLAKQVARMSSLADQLLDVSQLATKRLELAHERFDLGALAREIVARITDEVPDARISIDAREVVGRWDQARIDQVVTNLVTNAIKYGDSKPVSVRVDGDATEAILTVADQGIGIATDDQARIFERFERAVSPRRFGGLGLGLWIVKQLVDAHGGSINVASTPATGTTFTVTLPRQPA
ncbi:MAG: response regulator [Deltaproteobacteria bacterium]|nr:response regulator [Deltaproteobacteria bacterium]MDQ3296233.1 ATP-binding protein [Myxococcota bacterium]